MSKIKNYVTFLLLTTVCCNRCTTKLFIQQKLPHNMYISFFFFQFMLPNIYLFLLFLVIYYYLKSWYAYLFCHQKFKIRYKTLRYKKINKITFSFQYEFTTVTKVTQ